jgi:hypothetical protein
MVPWLCMAGALVLMDANLDVLDPVHSVFISFRPRHYAHINKSAFDVNEKAARSLRGTELLVQVGTATFKASAQSTKMVRQTLRLRR